jgi:nitroreductase
MADIIRIENLFARRSIRQYTGEPVTEDQIELLLKAGMAAPSANNQQPWHFIAVTDRPMLDKLAEAHPYAKMLHQAPLCICVIGDPRINENFWVQDCSNAAENILLGAVGLGLGGVWLGVYPRADRVEAIRQALKIPAAVTPLCLLAVGHPAETPPPRTQYDVTRVHRQSW